MLTKRILEWPKHFASVLCLLTSYWIVEIANAEPLRKVYLDVKHNVHIVTGHGRHLQLTDKKNAMSLKIAPDHETAAWLVMNGWTIEGDAGPESEELAIYRDGKIATVICRPFIRDYWFWENGGQVAIDCGGRHFAGREILYDVKTLKEVASFYEGAVPLEKRPDWSNADN